MKEFFWSWMFWGSLVFCSLLVVSLLAAYALYSAAPNNPNTHVFAAGFGFALGFLGLGAYVIFLYEGFSKKFETPKDPEIEITNKVIKEMPFFFFALLYFFSLAFFMGILLLTFPYVKSACSGTLN